MDISHNSVDETVRQAVAEATSEAVDAAIANRLLPPRYLNTQQAAAYIGFSVAFLVAYRNKGGGPRYTKTANAVRYDVRDLDAWMEARKVSSTSDSSGRSS